MHAPRVIVILIAAVALTLTLGGCWSDVGKVSKEDREKASDAALKYVGGGTVTDVERGEGDDDYEYEVEVTLPNGSDVDVQLDSNFSVMNNPPKATDLAGTPTPADPSADSPQLLDGTPLTGETLARASKAALKATGGGTVIATNYSDDADHVYEVEVMLPNDEQVTVELDRSYKVTTIDR